MSLFSGWTGEFTVLSIEVKDSKAYISVKGARLLSYGGACDLALAIIGCAETLWPDQVPKDDKPAPPTPAPAEASEAQPERAP